MRYANEDAVYHLLEIDPDTSSQTVIDIIDGVEEGIAQAIDLYTGRTFGVAPAQVTRDIAYQMNGGYPTFYTDRIYFPESGMYFFTNTLTPISGTVNPYVTPVGMRNVTEVFVDGTWDGTIWDGEEEVAVEDWRLVYTTNFGWSHGLLLDGSGYSSVRVTAEWEDLSYGEDIPPLIREIATEITVDEYRIRTQSPTGELGPPGLVTYIRNIWEHQPVKIALDHFKVCQVVV